MDEKEKDGRTEFAKAREANVEPVQEYKPEKTRNAIFKGMKWGTVAGWIVALLYIQMGTPRSLGFYPGDLTSVFLAFIGSGVGLGALFGWLSTVNLGEDEA
jgi:hypothetical protein